MHGHGDYCERYAYFAKAFAENGYDFVGMDMKGFGHSQGKRGVLDSEESLLNDHLEYFELVNSKFGNNSIPKFLLGHDLGGLLSLKLSIK